MNTQEVSNQLASGPLAGLVINLNTGANPQNQSTAPVLTPEQEAIRKRNQLYIAGGILALVVLVIFYLSFKKKR